MGGQGRKTIITYNSPKRYRKRCGLPKPPPLGATATTAASGGNREELLGQRPAGCERQRSRRWEPQPGQWHCEAMTERASPARKSRCAAMGRLFVRAILSLCQSCLAAALPSQALRASSPRGGAFARRVFFPNSFREFVENARLKREEFVNVIKMRRRY